jgi:hypothetical protein
MREVLSNQDAWSIVAALVIAGLSVLLSVASAEDAPAAPKPVHVVFTGYQELGGQFLFQFRVLGIPAADQPRLVKAGDRLNLGPLGPYTVGAFQHRADRIDPVTGQRVPEDTSSVEIIDAVGHKTELPFNRAVEVKPPSGALTNDAPPDRSRAAA